MAGELTIKDWTALNKANAALAPYTVLDIDAANSNAVDTAVIAVSGVAAECIGVCYDKARLDPLGAVIKNSGVVVRSYGFARVNAGAAIAAGAYVSTTAAAGVQTQALAGAGVVLKPIVGRALTAAGALGDRPVIMLMIGGRV